MKKGNSARKKIGVGIIGLNVCATAHLPALKALPNDYEVRALTAANFEAARKAATKFNVPLYFDDPIELISRPEIELVVVAGRVPERRLIVEAVLRAGKLVLSEWPLGSSLPDILDMEALAKKQGIRAFVGLQVQGAPYARYMRDLIGCGFIGDIISTTIVGATSKWGSAADPQFDFMLDRNNGATLLTIFIGHTLDTLSWVLGCEFRELSATLANRRPTLPRGGYQPYAPKTAEDQVIIQGTLNNGAVASVHYSGGAKRNTGLLWIINGSKGDIELTTMGNLQAGDVRIRGASGDQKELVDLPVPSYYQPQMQVDSKPGVTSLAMLYTHLLSDLRYGTNTVPTFTTAVRHHRVLDAIERASRTGQRQDLRLYH